jgi:hypothetical protein
MKELPYPLFRPRAIACLLEQEHDHAWRAVPWDAFAQSAKEIPDGDVQCLVDRFEQCRLVKDEDSNGDDAKLNFVGTELSTKYAQPIIIFIFVHSMAAWADFRRLGFKHYFI